MALRLLRGAREVARLRAAFRDLPQEVAAVFELLPAEREVWIPEEFQAGENRLSRRRPRLAGSGQEGVLRPPQDGVAANFLPWRADRRVALAGGNARPDPGRPDKVRWGSCPFYWPRLGRLESFNRRPLTQEVGEQTAGDDGGESGEPAEHRR